MIAAPAKYQSSCPVCGSAMDDAISGQCAGCLIGLVLSDEPESAPPSRGRFIGGYELIRQVGAGGMGVVYEARRESDGARVALKLIRDLHVTSATTLRRFTIEAEAVSRLDHPDIVHIHEVGECDEQPYLVMDFVDGRNLTSAMSAARAEYREKACLVARMSRAVHHAHLRRVIHRDLKPANILLDREGNPHLTDFGLAKILRPQTETNPPSVTGSGEAPGTPSYMAPEQVARGITSVASDIYSLGAVLYALLTGQPPFKGATPLETFKQILEQPPAPPHAIESSVPPDLETICLKCLEKDAGRRYSTAELLAEDLERFASGKPVLARRPSIQLRVRRWVDQNRVGTALIASLCVGLTVSLGLLAVVNQQRREIQVDRDQAFDDSMQRVSQIWRDPSTPGVTIPARELAILAGARPVDARDAQRVLFGVIANDGPSSMAQRYARWLTTLQQAVQRRVDEKVVFDLRLLKRFSSGQDALAGGHVDLIVVSAADFLRAQQSGFAPKLIGWAANEREGVIFARADSLGSLTDLRGRSVAFGGPSLALTFAAKARLLDAGLRAHFLAGSTNVLESPDEAAQESSAVIVDLVLRGDYDAGVIHRSTFERQKHRGLVMLEKLVEPPVVLAARPGFNEATAEALRLVLPETTGWPDSPFEAAATNSVDRLRELDANMQKAVNFDAPVR